MTEVCFMFVGFLVVVGVLAAIQARSERPPATPAERIAGIRTFINRVLITTIVFIMFNCAWDGTLGVKLSLSGLLVVLAAASWKLWLVQRSLERGEGQVSDSDVLY